MTYVDSLKRMCHMIVIGESLYAFARKIKCTRYHGKPFPHYDLTEQERLAALDLDAVEVSSKELVRLARTGKRQTSTMF